MSLFRIERIKEAMLRYYSTRSRKANDLKRGYGEFPQNLAKGITGLLSYFPWLYMYDARMMVGKAPSALGYVKM